MKEGQRYLLVAVGSFALGLLAGVIVSAASGLEKAIIAADEDAYARSIVEESRRRRNASR